jgi:hypothetical protein
MWRPNVVARGEEKEGAPDLSAGDGAENTASCVKGRENTASCVERWENTASCVEGRENTASCVEGREDTASCVSDKVTSYKIRQRTNLKDIVVVAHSLKWKWGGHLARKDQRRWAQATSLGRKNGQKDNRVTEDSTDGRTRSVD